MQKLLELYQQWKGSEPANVQQIPGGGSNRTYYRLTDHDGQTVIGVIGTSRDEDHAFIYLTEHFNRRKLPVPKILAASDDQLRYLQTDLGSMSLFDAVRGGREAGGRYTLKEQELLKRTIRELPNIQIRGARGLDFSNCYPQAEFNQDSVLFDLNYFKYCFLKATEIDFHELKLEADFRLLAKDLTYEESEVRSQETGDAGQESVACFLYRDFQARNVMLDHEGNPWFIDYQGGRKGPYYYDLASFLWQASAKYPHKLRRELVYEYYNSLKNYTEVPPVRHFVNRLSLFVLFRTLQVLGAYADIFHRIVLITMIILFPQSHFQEFLVSFADDDQDIFPVHEIDGILDGQRTHRCIEFLMPGQILVAAFQDIADGSFRGFVFRQNDDIQRFFTDPHHLFQTFLAIGIVHGYDADRFVAVLDRFGILADLGDRTEIICAVDNDIIFLIDPFHDAIDIRDFFENRDELFHFIALLMQTDDRSR